MARKKRIATVDAVRRAKELQKHGTFNYRLGFAIGALATLVYQANREAGKSPEESIADLRGLW